MSDPLFRKTHDGFVAVVELNQHELDYLLDLVPWNDGFHVKLADNAAMLRRIEAP